MITLVDEPEMDESLYPSDSMSTYLSGPFNLQAPGRPETILAVDLMQSGIDITVWDGGSGVVFSSEEFDGTVSKDGKTVTFTGKTKDSGKYTITPASYEDLQEGYSYLQFSGEDEAIRIVRGLIRRVAGSAFGTYTGGKLTDLGIVLEDGADNVLGLYVINKDGTFKRENGAWVAIDPEDEEANEEIEGGIWVEALDGIKSAYDEKENNDSLTLADFEGLTI